MARFLIAFLIIVAVVVGGLMAFRRGAQVGQPSQDVIDRVKIRERELEAQEKAGGEE